MPRDLRTSGISEKTSMSGRGCGILRVGFHERVLGHGGVPGKRGPTWNKTLSLVLGLICNLCPKTEWPCLVLATVAVGLLGVVLLHQARRLTAVVPHHLLKALRSRELVLIGLTLTAIALFAKITEDVVMHESTRFDITTLQTLHRIFHRENITIPGKIRSRSNFSQNW